MTIRSWEIFGCGPFDLSGVQLEALTTELLIEQCVVDPVMGGPSKSEQREHVLAELSAKPGVNGDGKAVVAKTKRAQMMLDAAKRRAEGAASR